MEEIQPPAIDGKALPVRVPALKFKRDAGTSWARALNPSQIADLVDLAGELSVIFPVIRERRVTEGQFEKKLHETGQYRFAMEKLTRIIGHTSGLVTLYHVWWSYSWVANYTKVTLADDNTELESHNETARRMGIAPGRATERLARRDVSFMVNLFLTRLATEYEGQIAWRTAQAAAKGGSRETEIYYRHIRSTGEDEGQRSGMLDPFNLSEGELMAEVERMRKQVATKQEDWQLPPPEEEEAEVE